MEIIDLNLEEIAVLHDSLLMKNVVLFGFKVSAQNFKQAVEFTKLLKENNPNIPIVWGGELPTLIPEDCLKYSTCVVTGLFENIADRFISDLQAGKLLNKYSSEAKTVSFGKCPTIDYNTVKSIHKYYSFMGMPLETSRGCTEKCTFCMVHSMQNVNYSFKTKERIGQELSNLNGHFLNVIDYNFAVNENHVLEVANAIKNSGAVGWMAEMCIESLDNENVLVALKESRCKIIYCGIETIEETALQSIHKMNTNRISNYERIIRKAQSYGIQVAAGIILGIEGMKYETFNLLFDFFSRTGIIYAKLTFLTYNPGTKSQKYMAKKGTFLSSEIEDYDGNHLTYVHNNSDRQEVISGVSEFIRKFYSFKEIVARSKNTNLTMLQRLEFILFNLCYRQVYLDWISYRIFEGNENFNKLLVQKFRKTFSVQLAEKLLFIVRKLQT